MPEHATLHETDLFSTLDLGASLITVNRRLSRSFLHRYHQYAQAQGQTAWETPDILPWSAWIARCLERAVYLRPDQPHPLPLTQDQELALWEEIIRHSEPAQGLLHVGETARQVRQAWILFRHWNLEDFTDPLLWTSPDQEAFLGWSREFQDRVDNQGWLEEARQPEYVAGLISQHGLSLVAQEAPPCPPQGETKTPAGNRAIQESTESAVCPCSSTLILAGFEQISPVQEHILEVLENQGCPTYILTFEEHPPRIGVLSIPDRSREMEYAACWARSHLQTCPDQRLGIIVPDLSQVREEIEHTFDAILHPDMASLPVIPRDRAFDISLGKSLNSYPLIQAALHILDLTRDPLSLSTLSAMLTSPFIAGGNSELSTRTGLEVALRSLREEKIFRSRLLGWVESPERNANPRACPVLAHALNTLYHRWQGLPPAQAPSAWARDIGDLLQDMGWPGERSLDSHEYQTVQAFHGCLQRFAALDRVIPSMPCTQAVSRLRSILTQTVFQPEGPQARVHIMGMLEAVGERFDRMWIMGLTDQIWPPAPEPSPFLPLSVQRRLGMPRSCPEHELDYARKITFRLQHSASEVILSHPLREEDRELLPSPLLDGLPNLDPDHLHLSPFPDPWLERANWDHLEVFSDQQGPALRVPGRAPGGSGLLRSQAACPFQAFARHRLGARSLDEPVTGLGPPERGTIIHAALEYFWQACPDQTTLLGLSSSDCNHLVHTAVDRAIQNMRSSRPLNMTKEFIALERERLVDLVQEWLSLERKRQPFRIHALEKRLDIDINGLNINVVVDRIDRLDNGKLVVIDYKAGKHSMSEWFQDRPVEPQIPLYSLFCPEPVAGVYFGVVRKGESSFVGLGEEEEIVPGCKGFDQHKLTQNFTSWEELLATWKTQLEDLAAEVLDGWAQVTPSNNQACRQCDLHSLCRIFELDPGKPR
ncbi:MAG: PD-(D/E)XK nuclease family protein [Desulfovermiculus sp.]|nr:PD-(D/E)XK nuclease family protein [Desulfovermiculus sp.]